MFEYTALVDAPVKRFTSIVTDPEPEESPVVVAVVTTIPPVAVPVVEAPALIMAVEPEPAEREAEPIVAAAIRGPVANPTPLAAPAPRPRTSAALDPTSRPSFLPALIGIAAAGVTAMWWLRRDSHDR
ncbi:MAG TPA: hypothetical protein VHL56_07470 [Candidatus Limnocylindrales bacterium]|jgi:hypothetical protein|nr:hypothetical protein [Candidatus Limnocylindrales bacterium]